MSVSSVLRGWVIHRDRSRCSYCKRRSGHLLFDPDGRPWHVDHVIPVSGGGNDEPTNLALACRRCNLSKATGSGPRPLRRRQPVERRTPGIGRPRGSGHTTIRVIAPIPAKGNGKRGTSGRLCIGRRLYVAMGSPARVDVVRDEAGRVRIRPGSRYAVNGPKCDTIPRIAVGQRTLDGWGMDAGRYSVRLYRGGIVVLAPMGESP